MGKRSRRADEVIPKLHYRPGVEDADLEATIVGFYGDRSQVSRAPKETTVNPELIISSPVIETPVVMVGDDLMDNCIRTPEEAPGVRTSDKATGVGPTGDITTPVARPNKDGLLSVSEILRQMPRRPRDPHLAAITAPTVPSLDVAPSGITASVATPVNKYNLEGPGPNTSITTRVISIPDIPVTDEHSNKLPTPPITPPDVTTPVVAQARPYNVHRAILAQDGHSHTEQLLYDILWRSAKSGQNDAYRFVQIPQSELAAAVRMTTKNLRIALDRLAEKLAIEEVQSFNRGHRIARTWKIFSYKAILERRKAAGMEWVVRDRGVRFVDPSTIPVKPTHVVMDEPTISTGVRPPEITPVAAAQTTPVKTTGPYLGQIYSTDQRSTPAVASPLIANAIISAFGFVDDEALQTLIAKCREVAADATDEEIAELGAMTARRILRIRNIENRVGLLISQTPKCFKGEPFAIYRREREERERRFAAEFQNDQS
ncbi:MAG TPA: hypothetical protein VME17_14520 [Bryobacteraceae bacterium]|nr:hypothetical protein [Bryobacteraceae bacterium]